MEKISRFVSLVMRGLFLRTDAYEEMREAQNPFVEGLFVILIVGVVIAVASIIGSTLEWATTPNLASIQAAIYDGITGMTWFQEVGQEIGPKFLDQFQSQWDWGWRWADTLVPTPLSSLANIVTTPLRLIVGWLIAGALSHLFARWMGGEATLSQTLGVTALAVAPQILHVAGLMPFVAVGAVVSTWSLICWYVAVKEAHQLSWGRSFWATVLPRLVLWFLILVVVSMVVALIFAVAPQIIPALGGS
ncbi:MAG TPA: Yip1 family protein [Anaerolineae bacterium]|nr:Yip1 family protein [Anaerolineae bacterium]